MHVILVRHGRPESVINSPAVADPGLCELGRWQADRLTGWLACENLDTVVTSPKARAIQTAAGVCADLGLSHLVIDDLDEIDRGAHTYLPTELLPTEGGDYWEKISQKRYEDIGWDTPEVFRDRVLSAWKTLCLDPPGERVLVVCHGGTIRNILSDIAGSPGAGFRIEYASMSRVQVSTIGGPGNSELTEPHCSIVSVNETGHFDAERSKVVGAFRGEE